MKDIIEKISKINYKSKKVIISGVLAVVCTVSMSAYLIVNANKGIVEKKEETKQEETQNKNDESVNTSSTEENNQEGNQSEQGTEENNSGTEESQVNTNNGEQQATQNTANTQTQQVQKPATNTQTTTPSVNNTPTQNTNNTQQVQQNQNNQVQTPTVDPMSKYPTYTRAQMEEIVQRAINYGKSLGLTYLGKEANKDNSSWSQPPATDRAYKYNVWLDISEALRNLKDRNEKYFGVQLQDGTLDSPAGSGHWTVYVLY